MFQTEKIFTLILYSLSVQFLFSSCTIRFEVIIVLQLVCNDRHVYIRPPMVALDCCDVIHRFRNPDHV
jgi:hypothetical protein